MPKPGELWTLAQATIWVCCSLGEFASNAKRDELIAKCATHIGNREKTPSFAYFIALHWPDVQLDVGEASPSRFKQNGETLQQRQVGKDFSETWGCAQTELLDEIHRGQIEVMGCQLNENGGLSNLSKTDVAGVRFEEDGEEVYASNPTGRDRHTRLRWRFIRFHAAQILARWPAKTCPVDLTAQRKGGGRPPAADWTAIEEALEREIREVGFPGPEHEPGWRTQADVVRWVEQICGNAEPGKTTLKDNTKSMLERIKVKTAGN
jgi:hypothetical protein